MMVSGQGMPLLVDWLTATVPAFLLVFSRTVGLFLQAHVFSSKQVPGTIRMGIIIGISILVMYAIPAYPKLPSMLFAFVLLAMQEFMLGALFGFAANFMFLAIQSAGELAGVQAGLSAASVQNPFTKSNVNAMGTLYFNVALLVFLIIGGHMWMLGGYVQSFKLVPLGTFALTPAVGLHLVDMSAVFLAITVQLAAPVVIVVFLAELGVGYMSKVAQQAQSLTQDLVTISKPVAGMTILILLVPNLMTLTYQHSERMIRDLDRLLRAAHATKSAGPPPQYFAPPPPTTPPTPIGP